VAVLLIQFASGIIGACGDDEQGQLFVNNMSSNGVDLSRLRKKKGHTAQVVGCFTHSLTFYVMALFG
jgi:sugar/nucleoside kinase (ribokinase family)